MTREKFQSDILPLRDKLYRYALSVVLDVNMAEDVVQEVLIKLWIKRLELEKVSNKEAWCIRMVRNKSIDRLRQRQRQPDDLTKAGQFEALTAVPDQAAEVRDLLEKIKEILDTLPEQQKEIFRLRELMGYSNAEIEEILSLNHSQVKVSLFRTRKIVREKIKKIINYGI